MRVLQILGMGVRFTVNVVLLLLSVSSLGIAAELGYGSRFEGGLKIFLVMLSFFLVWLVERQIVSKRTTSRVKLRDIMIGVPSVLLFFLAMVYYRNATISFGMGILLVLVVSILITRRVYTSRKAYHSQDSPPQR